MNKIIDQIKSDPRVLFFIICILGFTTYLITNVIMGVDVLKWMVQENNPDIRFFDFFMHVRFTSDPANLYAMPVDDTQGCFPPLSYVMYYLLYRLIYIKGFIPGRSEMEAMSGAYLVYVYYTLAVAFLLFFSIYVLSKEKNIKRTLLIFVCLMMSCPFFGGGFLTGNSAMLVLAMLLFFLAFKDSDSKALREVALILLAVCAGFKIYPAVFGLLYLKEKRFKEAIRVTVYGIVLFCVPFAFFGGLNGVKLWLGHIKGTMGLYLMGRIEYIQGIVYMLLSKLGISVETGVGKLCMSLIPLLFVLVMILLAALSKNKYRTILFLVAAITFYPTNAFRYTLAYFAIPLIIWLQDNKDEAFTLGNIEKYIFAILNGMVFSIPMILGFITDFKSGSGNWNSVEIWIYVSAYILIFIEIIYQIVETVGGKELKEK